MSRSAEQGSPWLVNSSGLNLPFKGESKEQFNILKKLIHSFTSPTYPGYERGHLVVIAGWSWAVLSNWPITSQSHVSVRMFHTVYTALNTTYQKHGQFNVHQCDGNDVKWRHLLEKIQLTFYFDPCPIHNMEETCTGASHQGAIQIICLQFWERSCRPFLYMVNGRGHQLAGYLYVCLWGSYILMVKRNIGLYANSKTKCLLHFVSRWSR